MLKALQNTMYQAIKKCGQKFNLDLPYLIRNGFLVIVRQGVVIAFGLVLSIAFARLVPQEVFGQYQFVLSVLAIVSVVSLPGLNASTLQSAARGFDGDYREAVRISFYWSLLGIPILLLIGTYYYFYQHATLGIAFMVAAIFFPFFYAPNTWDSFLQGKSRFKVTFEYASIQAILSTLFIIGIILLSRDSLLLIIFGYFVSNTFSNIFFYLKSLRYVENDKKGDAIHYGWFLTRINVLSMFADNLDKVVIGIFLGPEALAVYFLGITLTRTIFGLSKTVTSVLLPKIAMRNTAIFRYYIGAFFLIIPVTVLTYFLLPTIVPALFSEKYASAIELSQIAILFLPFVFINLFYLSHFLYYVKNKKIIAWHTMTVAFCKILLMIPLLIYFGTKGLAFMFGFQTVLSLLVLYILKNIFISNDLQRDKASDARVV